MIIWENRLLDWEVKWKVLENRLRDWLNNDNWNKINIERIDRHYKNNLKSK